MATQGERIAALEDTLGAIAAKLGVGEDAEPDATPKKSRKSKSRKSATEAKVKTITRNLDPVPVTVEGPDGDPIHFEVRATVPVPRKDSDQWGEGVSYNGARTLLLKSEGGRAAKALPGHVIRALADGGADALADAVETVEKRAKIGAHLQK